MKYGIRNNKNNRGNKYVKFRQLQGAGNQVSPSL